MRSYTGVVVVGAIVHNVSPQAGGLVESAGPIELQPDAMEFLCGHITRGLADSGAHGAKFVGAEPDRPGGLAAQLITSPDDLTTDSKAIARCLQSAMQGDERISAGSLAVAVCAATDAGVPIRFVALLKLDAANGFRTVEARTADGSVVLQLRIEPDMLPSPRERLQKAAFIRAPGAEYDCLIVDRQRPGAVISDYFIRGFLGAEPALDTAQRTRLLFDGLRDVRNEVAPQLATDDAEQLDASMQALKGQASVDLDVFVRDLRVGEEVRAQIDRVLRERLPADRQFELDVSIAQARLKRRTMVGDNLLRVSALADQWNGMVSVVDDQEQPGYKIVTIRTRTWREV